MPVTRRDLIFGLGGGVAGLTLSPLPWKLLDDVSIWTQRRHALPVPPRGEVSFQVTACTLCPAGCALRVRLVGQRPVGIAPERAHPLAGGCCALGLTLHHLPYHPLRLAAPARRVGGRLQPCDRDKALAEIVAAAGEARRQGRSVMVLDRRPGRVASQAWRELLGALPQGIYATPPDEQETLHALEAALESPVPLGLDLERTRTLLSFGAPVLEGWDRPSRVLGLRGGLHVVQAEAWRSATAGAADEWLAIPPGAEGPLALSLGHVVARERPDRADEGLRRLLADFDPRAVGGRIGLDPMRIERLGRLLLESGPSLAIGGGDPGAGPLGADAERAIALLDVLLGSLGAAGGIIPRRELPAAPTAPAAAGPARAVALADVPEGSVRLAILDGADDGRALPVAALRRALAKDALVVSLSPFDHELARQAQLLLPAPAPLEARDEILPAGASASASYALAAPLLAAPAGADESVALIGRLAAALGVTAGATHEERLKGRAALLQAAGRGRWLARGAAGYGETAVADADAAWQLLAEGGCWIDAPIEPVPQRLEALPLPTVAALERWRAPLATDRPLLVTCAARGVAGATPPSPLLTKLYQESDLRLAVGTALVHPDTVRALGLSGVGRARIEGPAGSLVVALRSDPCQPPGRVVLASGPERVAFHAREERATGALVLVAAGPDGAWRGAPLRVGEA